MSTSDPQLDVNTIQQVQKQIHRMVEEISRLSEQDLEPAAYYGEFLQRVLRAILAPAGAVWIRNSMGHLQLQYQINLAKVEIDRNEASRQSHQELLRQVILRAQPMILAPQSGAGASDNGGVAPGNPTDYVNLIVPILVDKQVAGLVEIWQNPNRNLESQRGILQFLTRMAELASHYTRNHRLRQMVGQQTLWAQLEAFARQVHGTLNPTEVAYLTANEGRRLVECDRISVAQRLGQRTRVEAISGADVVEKRSNLVQLMRALFEKAVAWGEKVVYTGLKDETLPPDVLQALDNYLAESNSKLLVLLPLRDEREGEGNKPVRSALMMECFEPSAAPEQMMARLEVVGRHATSALYNAIEHRRIPMRFLWEPLAHIQDGLGGKTRAILWGVGVGVFLFLAIMILVPYPLKMEANGQLLPVERRWVYSPNPGKVLRFEVETGQDVKKGQNLVLLHDPDLQLKLITLDHEISGLGGDILSLADQYSAATNSADRLKISGDKSQKQQTLKLKQQELRDLRERTKADESGTGNFWLKSTLDGAVLNSGFWEEFGNRPVKPTDRLLRIGDKQGPWEIELKIPQKNIGQILQAFDPKKPELEVDFLTAAAPTRVFKGILERDKIAGEAASNPDDASDSEPVVLAYVRIEGAGIRDGDRLPRELLLAGTEVHAKVRCGNHAMGYSLFYGVWEFLYEKVVFFF